MMSDIILANTLPVPSPKVEINFREATLADIKQIDDLQKLYNKNLGFLQTQALEGKINLRQVLIAENAGEMLGYIIAQDRYFKRDELGIVTQLVVVPGKQRSFIGAALLQAQFNRSAYGCRLYCCWCAQDLSANYFWESMGFYPLAYRMGSEKKARVHIFWQKKIRGKDDTINWWYPHKTDQGAMRADRLVFPIPPEVNWKNVQPIVIPGVTEEVKQLPVNRSVKKEPPKIQPPTVRRPQYGRPGQKMPVQAVKPPEPKQEKPKRLPKPKIKIDPMFIDKARELRDRYLEEVNEKGYRLESAGKYELIRQLDAPHPDPLPKGEGEMRLLEAA